MIEASFDDSCDDCVAQTAAWDPAGDDPKANYDDGQPHPDEAPIQDRTASHEAKMEAWLARAERLNEQGKVIAAGHATHHAEYHGARVRR
jgi:hypothetical protein